MPTRPRALLSNSLFGTLPEGDSVECFTLRNDLLELDVIAYGARVVALRTPDRRGDKADVVLGYGDLPPYVQDRKSYFGCVAGRYANRLAGGRFTLEGAEYRVPANDGANALHGGAEGFDRRLWSVAEIEGGVEFTLVSPDGDQGFPGELTASVRYTLAGDAVRLDYAARTSKPTVLNLTNHAYFNLAGEGAGTVLNHDVQIMAEAFTPVNVALIPTGELALVAGTPFDFLSPRRIGERIDETHEQLERARGYDHNWVLGGQPGALRPCATVTDAESGRTLRVETTEPGVQFYSGNFLDGTRTGKSGKAYKPREGFCLETQHFPDSPHQDHFPSTVLRPGETYASTTAWTFGVL